MNPESHRLYHRELQADTARGLRRPSGSDVPPRGAAVRARLLRVLARLRRASPDLPEAPPARAPR